MYSYNAVWGALLHLTTKGRKWLFLYFIAWNSRERTGNYPNKQHYNFFGNLSRACEQPPWEETSVVSIRRNVAEVLATDQIPAHAKRKKLRRLIYRSSQVPPLTFWEHFNYTRICSHANMVVSTWHWINTCECWVYSEATVALMPQGVAA